MVGVVRFFGWELAKLSVGSSPTHSEAQTYCVVSAECIDTAVSVITLRQGHIK